LDYWLHLLCLWGVFALQAVALNVLVGEMGLVSLCHAGFFGLGAYALALLVTRAGLPPLAATALAPAVAGGAALLVGSPLRRVDGDFFAIATFGVALVLHGLALHWTSVTGGAFGMVVPLWSQVGAMGTAPARWLFTPTWVVVGVVLVVTYRWRKAPRGRVLNAIREDEALAVSLGRPTDRHRAVAFCIVGGISGLAGALHLWLIGLVDPSGIGVMESVMLVAMVVVGGSGSNVGAVAGAALVVVLPELLRLLGLEGPAAANSRQILFGIALYAVLLFRPRGLLGRLEVGIERRA